VCVLVGTTVPSAAAPAATAAAAAVAAAAAEASVRRRRPSEPPAMKSHARPCLRLSALLVLLLLAQSGKRFAVESIRLPFWRMKNVDEATRPFLLFVGFEFSVTFVPKQPKKKAGIISVDNSLITYPSRENPGTQHDKPSGTSKTQ